VFNEVPVRSCARCGAPLVAGARFCSACGALVTATTSDGAPVVELAGERYEIASFWRRAGAFLLDGVFWNVVSWPLAALLQIAPDASLFPTLEPGEAPTEEFWTAFAQAFDVLMLYLVAYTLTVAVAQLVLEAYGWTPGKAALGLRIVRDDGHRPGPVHALARAFTRILSAVPLLLGYLWVAWDPRRQAWHDKLAHTYVVRLPDATRGGVTPARPRDWGPLATGVGPWVWASLQVLLMTGTVFGALGLAAALPDDGASWQRFFEGIEAPPSRVPGQRTAQPSPLVPLLVDLRGGAPLT
jgi:uncharacterized RDD family membrane protein YckC